MVTVKCTGILEYELQYRISRLRSQRLCIKTTGRTLLLQSQSQNFTFQQWVF